MSSSMTCPNGEGSVVVVPTKIIDQSRIGITVTKVHSTDGGSHLTREKTPASPTVLVVEEEGDDAGEVNPWSAANEARKRFVRQQQEKSAQILDGLRDRAAAAAAARGLIHGGDDDRASESRRRFPFVSSLTHQSSLQSSSLSSPRLPSLYPPKQEQPPPTSNGNEGSIPISRVVSSDDPKHREDTESIPISRVVSSDDPKRREDMDPFNRTDTASNSSGRSTSSSGSGSSHGSDGEIEIRFGDGDGSYDEDEGLFGQCAWNDAVDRSGDSDSDSTDISDWEAPASTASGLPPTEAPTALSSPPSPSPPSTPRFVLPDSVHCFLDRCHDAVVPSSSSVPSRDPAAATMRRSRDGVEDGPVRSTATVAGGGAKTDRWRLAFSSPSGNPWSRRPGGGRQSAAIDHSDDEDDETLLLPSTRSSSTGSPHQKGGRPVRKFHLSTSKALPTPTKIKQSVQQTWENLRRIGHINSGRSDGMVGQQGRSSSTQQTRGMHA